MIAMRRIRAAALMGTAGLAWMLAPGLGAQQPTDPMQDMSERMQSMQSMMTEMHQMMMSMHGGTAGPAGQHGMGMGMGLQGQGMQGGQQGMGMGMQGQPNAGSCSMGNGFGALLGACPSTLALTEAQTTELDAIFERARSEALATLTPQQHEQLHATPSQTGGPQPR